MQCSKCGATVRSGMVECPQCGAPVSSASSTPQYRPGGSANVQAGYIPGGGLPKQTEENEPEQQPQRPLGSLQRRLQRSQMSMPNDYDDEDDDPRSARPPSRGSDRSPRSRPIDGPRGGQARPPRPPSGDGYGERGQRSRPATRPPRDDDARYGSRGPSSRGRVSRDAYDDESRGVPSYSGGNRWDDEPRDLPAQRGGGGRDRYRPPEDSMEMSAEMSIEAPAYLPARRPTSSRRGSRPVDGRRDAWDDYGDPMDDPRAPISGAPGRRPSQGVGPGRRGSNGYDASRDGRPATRRPADSYAGYTEGEMSAPGYTDYGDSYGGYPDARRDDIRSGGRDPRGRGGNYAPPRGRGEYTDFGVPAAGWGEPSGYTGEYSGFGDSAWQPALPASAPPGAAGNSRVTGRGGGSQQAPKAKRKRGVASTLFWMFTMLVMAAGLGVEVGPQIYHFAQRRGLVAGGSGGQAATTCGAEATPSASLNPPAGSTGFATTAYTLAYPSGWQKNAQSGSSQGQCDVVFAFSQPGGAAKLTVEQAGAFAPLTDAQVIAAEAQSAQAQGSLSEITSAATTQTIGGEVWQRHEYQVTLKDGTKLHLALLAGHHKGAGFAIILLSSDSGFATDDTTSFEPVLKSFQFV